MLGYMNIPEKDWEKAQKMIQKSNDWIGVNELDKKPKYKRFNDFITKIVYPAVEDINNKTDIEIEGIKIISHGRSQERKEIKFIIKKKNIVTSALKEEQDYIQFIRAEIFSDIKVLTDSDINMFYEIAEKHSQNFSPLEYIQINYDYILDHDVEQENFVAYLKKALENDYAETNEI